MAETLLLFMLQLAIILVATRIGSLLAMKLGFTLILGELLMGIVLGPTVFGAILPEAQRYIFPGPGSINYDIMQNLSWLGLILLAFLGGLDIELGVLRANLWRAISIASFTLILSLAACYALLANLPDSMFPSVDAQAFHYIGAIALTIMGVPLLIKLLMDLKLMGTRFGATIAIAGIMLTSVCWILLGIVTRGIVEGYSLQGTMVTLGLILAFLLATLIVGRFVFKPVVLWSIRHDGQGINAIALVLALMLAGALATSYLNIHPVLGAFTVGIMVGSWRLPGHIREKIQSFSFAFFIPIFIVSMGLRTNLLKLDSWEVWSLTLVVVIVAGLARFGGALLGALVGGMRWREGLASGIAINTQGAMGLAVATVGYELRIVSDTFFSILVLVATILTLLPVFALHFVQEKDTKV
jgi:Kef-type K+ transport system membrane component KefB